jgi:formylglycine-generating enzyme required for sulfatase activity
MAGNVWQWTANVYDAQHYRYMRGGSKDMYENNLRVWSMNNATPTFTSPGTGFRCVRDVE